MTPIASELGRYDIQISAALSETHFAREGQLFEIGTEYIIFWSGRSEDERSQAGLGFVIKSDVFAKHKPPRGVNDRLLTLRLPLSGKHFVGRMQEYRKCIFALTILLLPSTMKLQNARVS